MPLKSTQDRYGAVAITIHWASALGIAVAFGLGLAAANTPDPATELTLVRGHVVFAIGVLLLTLLRILWWWFADRHPAPAAGQSHWRQVAASIVHNSIYVVILLMGTSGIATLIASGAVPTLLAGGTMPDLDGLIPRIAHGFMSRLLLLLLVVHVGAALHHQFIRRDRLLARMGVGAA